MNPPDASGFQTIPQQQDLFVKFQYISTDGYDNLVYFDPDSVHADSGNIVFEMLVVFRHLPKYADEAEYEDARRILYRQLTKALRYKIFTMRLDVPINQIHCIQVTGYKDSGEKIYTSPGEGECENSEWSPIAPDTVFDNVKQAILQLCEAKGIKYDTSPPSLFEKAWAFLRSRGIKSNLSTLYRAILILFFITLWVYPDFFRSNTYSPPRIPMVSLPPTFEYIESASNSHESYYIDPTTVKAEKRLISFQIGIARKTNKEVSSERINVQLMPLEGLFKFVSTIKYDNNGNVTETLPERDWFIAKANPNLQEIRRLVLDFCQRNNIPIPQPPYPQAGFIHLTSTVDFYTAYYFNPATLSVNNDTIIFQLGTVSFDAEIPSYKLSTIQLAPGDKKYLETAIHIFDSSGRETHYLQGNTNPVTISSNNVWASIQSIILAHCRQKGIAIAAPSRIEKQYCLGASIPGVEYTYYYAPDSIRLDGNILAVPIWMDLPMERLVWQDKNTIKYRIKYEKALLLLNVSNNKVRLESITQYDTQGQPKNTAPDLLWSEIKPGAISNLRDAILAECKNKNIQVK